MLPDKNGASVSEVDHSRSRLIYPLEDNKKVFHQENGELRNSNNRVEFMEELQVPEEVIKDNTKLKRSAHRIQRIGMVQIVLAALSIIVSIVTLVEVDRISSGSGLWCAIFFFIVGGFNCMAWKAEMQFTVMAAFGLTCLFFALTMFVSEIVEMIATLSKNHVSKMSLPIHAFLLVIAAVEVFLIILSLAIYHDDYKYIKEQSAERRKLGYTTTSIVHDVMIEETV